MKLATTTGDFGAYTVSQAEAVRCIRQAGFRYADYDFGKDYRLRNGAYQVDWLDYSQDLKRQAEEIGIRFVQAHSPMGKPIAEDNAEFIADTIRCIEVCHQLEIPNLVVHSGYAPGLSIEETFERNKAFYRPLLEVAQRYGINILVENFNKMCIEGLYWIDNAKDLRALIDYIDHPNFHAVWDAGHGNLQEMPQHEELKLLGNHVLALHIQDNMGEKDEHRMPLTGTLNLDSVMYGLQEIGYQGYFTFEAGSRFLPAEKRRPFPQDTRLAKASLALRLKEEELLYEIGKFILESYGRYEE